MFKIFKSLLTFLVGIVLYVATHVVSAQETIGDDSTVIYPASYFAEWAPVTAQDMIDRIPGLDMGSMASFSRSSRGSRGSSTSRGGA